MRKYGILEYNGRKYHVLEYEADSGLYSRIDVTSDLENYSFLSTMNCDASEIVDSSFRYVYGDEVLINVIHNIIESVLGSGIPETLDNTIEDGVFTTTICKEDTHGTKIYYAVQKNAFLTEEAWCSTEGTLSFIEINNASYNGKDRPANFGAYLKQTYLLSGDNLEAGEMLTSDYAYTAEELLKMHPDVAHVLDNDYVIAQSLEEAKELLHKWETSDEVLKSVDIESLGKVWDPQVDNKITGIFLGFGFTHSYYFPIHQDNFPYNLPEEWIQVIFDAIAKQPAYPNVIILAHNAKFEIQGFWHHLHKVLRVDADVYILSLLDNPEQRVGLHTLKHLAYECEGKMYLNLPDCFKDRVVRFNVLTPDVVKLYGCPDATSPAKVYTWIMKRLPKDSLVAWDYERQLPKIKALNEYYGLPMDVDGLDKQLNKHLNDAELLLNIFKKLSKVTGNINSPVVLRELLYTKMALPVLTFTDKGEPSVSAETIATFIRASNSEEKLWNFQDIRSEDGSVLIKAKSINYSKVPALIVYQAWKDISKMAMDLTRIKKGIIGHRFKFYINQLGTASSRESSDAQQFSDDMKQFVIADSSRHRLASADYKQIEYRVLAGMAHITELTKLASDPEVDLHRAIYSLISKLPMWNISAEQRKKAKATNFGIVYMMTKFGLAQSLFKTQHPTEDQLKSAQQTINEFLNTFPEVKRLMAETADTMLKYGYARTAFGFYRPVKDLLDPLVDPKKKAKLLKAGNNTPIQGTAAGILKIATLALFKYAEDHNWFELVNVDGLDVPKFRLMLTIHDEMLTSSYDEISMEEMIYAFKEAMEMDIDGFPPLYASPAFVNNWLDGKNSAYEIDIPLRDKIIDLYKQGKPFFKGWDTYLEQIAEYREQTLDKYMSELIAEYKTEDQIAEHVRHDTLTHTLIDAMYDSEMGSLSHIDRIKRAVHLYLEKHNSKNVDTEAKTDDTVAPDYTQDDAYQQLIEASYLSALDDAIGEVSSEGVVLEGLNEEPKDESLLMALETEATVKHTKDDFVESAKYLYTIAEVILFVDGMSNEAADNILKKVFEKSDPNNPYSVVICIKGGKLLSTGMKIAYIPEYLDSIFMEVHNG